MNITTRRLVLYPFFGMLSGAAVLFSIYALLLSWLNSPEHAWSQYQALQPWISLLIIGFGIQVGLFTYLHQYRKVCTTMGMESGGAAGMAASGSISAGSMVACCLHHGTDVLPLLGLTAAATFLTKYQLYFVGAGVMSNVLGIGGILYTIHKHKWYQQSGTLHTLPTSGGRL